MKLDKEKTVIVHKATCNHGKTETLKKLAFPNEPIIGGILLVD